MSINASGPQESELPVTTEADKSRKDAGLYCLVPIRNGAPYLKAFFACMDALDASVIALDDGSTDNTRELLAEQPRVRRILTNPVRPDFTGWDDAENRSRLLDACADFPVRWVLWLDIDELIPEGDAALLLEFLRSQARPEMAYGLEVLRMIGDAEHFDRSRLWVYRLFAYREGLTLPTEKLHFEPVPLQIPDRDWVKTRLRILHFSSVTSEAREQRFLKYRQADPDCRWQESYEEILDEPEHIWKLKPLDPAKGVLFG